ncbi:MAG: GspH/FimT family pseudopilin [Thiobacillus sp.]|nr:GspH/FimT family pseudopilin [Thiobacillus sp.]
MKQSGVTLLELMVVLSVAGILLAIGVPALTSLTHSSRLSSFANELISSMHLTRSEAIKRNSRAVMCPSVTGTSCAVNGGWHQGWLVFHDPNNNAVLDAGETVIMTRQALPSGLWAKSTEPTAIYISYAPSGGTKKIGGAWQAGTLTLCNESGSSNSARKVIISSTGRPRTEKTTVASCP